MAKKQNSKKQSTSKSKKDSKYKQLGVILIIIVFAGFFLFKDVLFNNEPEVEYYTFTKEGELTFTDSLGTQKSKIDIEIADNVYERSLGLMNRNEMKETQGMLFIFPKLELQSFWMRNTLISLDIMFVNDQKKIVTIHKNTKILSDSSYRSSEPSIYVVEVLAGFAERHNIQVGDKINWMGTRLANPN